MKRICGTTAVEGRVRLERDVKVLSPSLSLSLSLFLSQLFIYMTEKFSWVFITD
jgi:hypothetical protein